MKPGAYSRYYEKNRDVLLERMRQRDAERRATKRELLDSNPDLLEEEREKMRQKYYRRVSTQVKKQIDEWLLDKTITDTFKTFLRDCCIKDDKYKTLTLKTLRQLKELPIASSAVDSLRIIE
jgi:hypothetical protein